MKVSDFIPVQNVLLDLAAPSKLKVIEAMAKKAGAAVGIPDGVICDALQRRETLGSTGVGEGVAIPHAPVPGLVRPIGWLAKLRNAVEFDAIDGLPVDIVLVLLTPADGPREHLSMLACAARRLRSQEVLRSIRNAASTKDLYSALAIEP